VIDFAKPFCILVNASYYAVGGILTQTGTNSIEYPVAFASSKFTETQRNWATIEKEAYAVVWALNKFKCWIFGKPITVYTDHNPLVYLRETVSKSAKLIRWASALQEFDVQFKFRAGKCNGAPDCLTRMIFDEDR